MRNLILPRWLLVSFVVLQACSPKIKFLRSQTVPGAEGKVTVKKDKNQNYKIQVNVMHLAPPQDLPAPAQTYVVWMESADNGVKNLGQLKSGSNIIRRVRTASLETVSSLKPTRIFITPENDATTEYPTGQEIIATGSL